MKVKVDIYSQKSLGAPLNMITDSVYGDAESYDDISALVVSAITSASAFLPDQDVTTLVQSMGISRWLDIINLQKYFQSLGFVLSVTEVTSEPVKLGTTGAFIEIVSPRIDLLPVSTVFYDESGNYDILQVVSQIVDKFNLGDPSIIPTASIRQLISAFNNMEEHGMQVFPMYNDQLLSELADYGFELRYIYLD